MARNLCLFAHFDISDRVDPYVLRYLEAIRSNGFDIVFISTSALPESELLPLRYFCRDVMLRPNYGMDFGSWSMGYAKHGQSIEGELLLANDSVYASIGRLDSALQRLRALPGDVRGMVESLEHEQHIQSWFVLLSPKAHHSCAFREIIAQDFTQLTKAEIIKRGEIALSSHFHAAGLTSAALFSLAHRKHHGAILRNNPTHIYWKELIEVFGIPFIKVELLRDNPLAISDASQWRAVLGTRAPELIPLIEMHLSRSKNLLLKKRWGRRFFPFLTREAFMRRDLRLDLSGKLIKKTVNRYLFEIIATLDVPIARNLYTLFRHFR